MYYVFMCAIIIKNCHCIEEIKSLINVMSVITLIIKLIQVILVDRETIYW